MIMPEMTIERAWPAVFTPFQARLLSDIQSAPIALRPRQQISSGKTTGKGLLYLSSGLVGIYRLDRMGRRQFLSLNLPGDYVDLFGFLLGHWTGIKSAFGAATVKETSYERFQALDLQEIEINKQFWRISMIEASISRYWIFRIGRLVGRARIANFLCEMLVRLHARGLCSLDGFDVPLAQTDIAEICGMTPVHASRMLSELREDGICTFAQGSLRVMKLPALFQAGQYRWDYLYLGADLDREIRERASVGPLRRRASA
ncbi:Crp/Fnr family transcriptional regulator [Paracoccus niistensis]|uniref:Crp/Fnr family transcriptional regulator n=1 Tax=Paracoccus niistensis TaxID=632935 RepID=A0ABV6I528_9RHOB